MEFIDAPGMNSFDRLFLTPMTFTQTFDHCILWVSPLSLCLYFLCWELCFILLVSTVSAVPSWKNPSCNLEHIKQMQLTERLVDCNGNTAHAMLPSVCSLMNKALGPRVKLTALQQMPLPQVMHWSPLHQGKLSSCLLIWSSFPVECGWGPTRLDSWARIWLHSQSRLCYEHHWQGTLCRHSWCAISFRTLSQFCIITMW